MRFDDIRSKGPKRREPSRNCVSHFLCHSARSYIGYCYINMMISFCMLFLKGSAYKSLTDFTGFSIFKDTWQKNLCRLFLFWAGMFQWNFGKNLNECVFKHVASTLNPTNRHIFPKNYFSPSNQISWIFLKHFFFSSDLRV